MTCVYIKYDQEKKYKLGCVISCFERPLVVKKSLESISKSFLPSDLLFLLVDDGSKKTPDLKFDHDHLIIRKSKNYGISHSLALGWDILHAMGVEYMMNLDSDVEVSKNWLSRLIYTHECVPGESIVTGFNGAWHDELLVVKNKYVSKSSMGGINLFFDRRLYGTVRKSLTTCESVPTSIEEAIGLMEAYGSNPRLHEEYKGWDWGLMSLCEASKVTTACTTPSVVEHTGIRGMTSSKNYYETARDFQNVCVPKIIHQMWRDENVPDHLKAMQSSVQKNNPQYKYMFWTDEEINKFVCSEYLELMAFYDSFQYVIQKADFARLLILYHFGGAYVDLDSMCFGKIDGLLGFPVSFVRTEKHPAFSDHYPFILNNAFISAEKNNDFIKKIIHNIIEYKDPPDYRKYCSFDPAYTKVLMSAGPLCVTDSYMKYDYKSMVNILNNNYYKAASIEKDDVDKMIKVADSISKETEGCRFLHIHESSWWRANGKAVQPPKNEKHRTIPEWYRDKIKLAWR